MSLYGFFTTLAVLLSLAAFYRSRRLDKRDLFLRMHTDLLDEIPMRGRRVLGTIFDVNTATWAAREVPATEVYRALAMFDVLGLYVEQGWVDRWTVMEEWGRSLSAYREPKRLWVAARWPNNDEDRWPHYDLLAESAAKYLAEGRPSWGYRLWLDLRDQGRRTTRRLA